MVEHIKNILSQDNIDCIVTNTALSGGMGEIPPIECWPELWVIHNEDYDHATTLINNVLKEPVTSETSWQCQCGEYIEQQFSHCWKCNKGR